MLTHFVKRQGMFVLVWVIGTLFWGMARADDIATPWEYAYQEMDTNGPHVLGLWKFDANDGLDATGKHAKAELRAGRFSPAGKFGGALESFAGFSEADRSHGFVVPNTPRQFGKAQSAPQPFWTKEQTELIVAASKPAYQAYFRFLAETGVRAGEAIWLTWADVDFQNGVIHIQPKEGWKPKTGDQRVIPMSPALRHMLEAQPRIARWVFCARPSAGCRQVGRQIDSRRALASLKTVLKRLGLPGHQHTFRHSFISHALTRGVPEAIVRSWVGHVDDHIIRTYTHIADQISRDAMRKLSAPDGEPANGDGPAAA